jgi:hypothetical protein
VGVRSSPVCQDIPKAQFCHPVPSRLHFLTGPPITPATPWEISPALSSGNHTLGSEYDEAVFPLDTNFHLGCHREPEVSAGVSASQHPRFLAVRRDLGEHHTEAGAGRGNRRKALCVCVCVCVCSGAKGGCGVTINQHHHCRERYSLT